MKTMFLGLLILLVGCSKNLEEVRVEVDSLYKKVRAIPASNYCGNLKGYIDLRSLEKKYRSKFYSDITEKKIETYDAKCREETQKKIEAEKLAKDARESIVLRCVPREKVQCSPLSSNYNGKNYLFKLNSNKKEVTSINDTPYISRWKKLINKVEGNRNFRDVLNGNERPSEPGVRVLYTEDQSYSWFTYVLNRRTLIMDLGYCPDMSQMFGYTKEYNGSIHRGESDCELVDYQVFDRELKAIKKDIIEHDDWVKKNKHRLTEGNKI